MARIYGQAVEVVLETTSSLAASAVVTGSAISLGYATLIGIFISNASTTASGLRIQQSSDFGAHWDHETALYTLAACVATSVCHPIYGNAVKVSASNAITAASIIRGWFALRPI